MKIVTYTTNDGHKVRSRAEVIVDNILYDQQIPHQYEIKLQLGDTELRPDWFLPKQNAIIEFWGMEDKENYTQRQIYKLKLYAEHSITCLSLNDADLVNSKTLRQKIIEFVTKYSSTVGKEPITPPVTTVKRDSQSVYVMKQGKRCYFCLKHKKTNRKKPLCPTCYEKLMTKAICSFCGEILDEVITDSDKYSAYICDPCDESIYDSCKLCNKVIESPSKGKPLCYICYSVISQASPGLPTPKWIRKRHRQRLSDF